jgi:calcineurin-like phosphoesterase
MPAPFDVAVGDVRLCGALVEVDTDTGKAISIERIEIAGGKSDAAYDADDRGSPQNHGGD